MRWRWRKMTRSKVLLLTYSIQLPQGSIDNNILSLTLDAAVRRSRSLAARNFFEIEDSYKKSTAKRLESVGVPPLLKSYSTESPIISSPKRLLRKSSKLSGPKKTYLLVN